MRPEPDIRKRLLAGEVVIGSWISSASPIVAELMADAGFDFLCIDVEHSAVDLAHVQQIFQAIAAGNPRCAPLVRLHGVDYALVKRFMDAGARGVVAPLVTTAAEVQVLLNAVKYPPLGNRGVGYCRANRYGRTLPTEFAQANDLNLVAVQIEHIDAVNALDEILGVEGVDAAFIGPYDLTASMGITAEFDHPDYLKAKNRILEACRRHGVAPGIHVVQPDHDALRLAIEEGYRLIAYSLDITILGAGCDQAVANIKALREKKDEE